MKNKPARPVLGLLFMSAVMMFLTGQEKGRAESPPIIGKIPDIVINQNSQADRVLDLWKYTTDADTPMARILFNLVVPPKRIGEGSARATLEANRYVNLSPDPNWTGIEEIRVEANDGSRVSWARFKVIVSSSEAGRIVEAEDQTRVTREGNWEEFSEGRTHWLQAQARGDKLKLKFRGSFLAVSFWNGNLNLLQRYYEMRNADPLNAWKTYPSGRASIRVDGTETRIIDLSEEAGQGWNEYLAAEGLAPSEHDLEIAVLQGFVNVDKIRASLHPLSELNFLVADAQQTPLADIVLKFRQADETRVILRTRPDGRTPAFFGLKPGTYDVRLEPDSSPGYLPPRSRIDENIKTQGIQNFRVEEGQAYRLRFTMEYSDAGYRSLQFLRRPIRTLPAIVQCGGTFHIECQYPTRPKSVRAWLIPDGQAQPIELAAAELKDQAIRNGLREGLVIKIQVPSATPPSLYDLKIILDDSEDSAPRAVRVVAGYKKEYRFAQVSDLHIRSSLEKTAEVEKLLQIARVINLLAPEFVLISGDITDSGSRPEYLRFLRVLRSLEVPVYAIPGNHDHYFFTSRNYLSYGFDEYEKYLGQKFFSFHYGNDSFICLDTGDYEQIYESPLSGVHDGQWPWLVQELSTAVGLGRGLTCVLAHNDYTALLPNYYELAGQLIRLFKIYPIGLFLYGHGHINREERFGENSGLSLETPSSLTGQFRLLEVHNGKIISYPVLDATKLEVDFRRPNDGSEEAGRALLKNGMDTALADIKIGFNLRHASPGYTVDNGRILEIRPSHDRKRATVVVCTSVPKQSEIMVNVFPVEKGP